MPSHIYNLLSQEAKDALQKYNVEAIQKLKASRNMNETQFIHTMSEYTQDEVIPIIDEEQFQQWIAPRIFHYISFALHFICTLHLHLKIVPRQHEMHDMSRFKCHALHLHFMK